MGIPYYVASLIRSHKHIQKKCLGRIDVDVLGIDFNCFIYKYIKSENPIGSIVVALNDLLTKHVRAKRVYIAFDGLVPYAKMVQQRYRRMRVSTDTHQISPGTPFMRELADTLRVLFPECVVSDTLEPGEGEHKIFGWLKTIPDRKTICIYGLDADLVLIALAQSYLGDIQILRELEGDGDPMFATLSVSALEKVLPLEKDEYIRRSIMYFGNDFMPTIAMFSLREGGYERAMKTPNTPETAVLLKHAKNPAIVSVDGHAIEQRFACQRMDGVVNWEAVCYAFWKTYEWTYHYFTTSEILDWEWYYPYPEAPLMDTLDSYPRPTTFEWASSHPTMTVEDQLRFILPESSLRLAGLTPVFPDELYDEATDTRRLWMKRFAWESDPWVSLPHGPLTEIFKYEV